MITVPTVSGNGYHLHGGSGHIEGKDIPGSEQQFREDARERERPACKGSCQHEYIFQLEPTFVTVPDAMMCS